MKFPKAIAILGAVAVIIPSAAVNAQTVSKFTNNGNEYVVIDGIEANTRVSLQLDSQDLVRRSRGNACGWIRISNSASYPLPSAIQISEDSGETYGASIDVTSLSTESIRCQNGVILNGDGTNTPPSGNFKDSSGAVVITGKVQNQQYSIKYVGTPASSSGNANACGFRQVSHSPTRNRDLTSFTYDGTSYNLTSLTEANPPLCRRVGDSYVRYEEKP
ncbi:MAG: hypothetical protein SWJ54_16265 [Cyanobacteriota bacterium]|nr:hypothetical protein [Cyanobacteriota bacterium]